MQKNKKIVDFVCSEIEEGSERIEIKLCGSRNSVDLITTVRSRTTKELLKQSLSKLLDSGIHHGSVFIEPSGEDVDLIMEKRERI